MNFKTFNLRKRGYGGPCWLCRRRDNGTGLLDGDQKWSYRAVWTCERHGKELYEMAKKLSLPEFDRIEQEATLAAGGKAGEYLDSIGVTDLALLSEVQWVTFLKTIIVEFGDRIEKHLEETPF